MFPIRINLVISLYDMYHRTEGKTRILKWTMVTQHCISLLLLPPANEVWCKVICLQVCVCQQGGGVWSRGDAWSRGSGLGSGVWSQGGACSQGVPGLGGLVPGGAWSLGGAWWRPPGWLLHPTGMHSCFEMFVVRDSFLDICDLIDQFSLLFVWGQWALHVFENLLCRYLCHITKNVRLDQSLF